MKKVEGVAGKVLAGEVLPEIQEFQADAIYWAEAAWDSLGKTQVFVEQAVEAAEDAFEDDANASVEGLLEKWADAERSLNKIMEAFEAWTQSFK